MYITNQADFIKLVKQEKIAPSLKTYSDTLLFYYFGHLALSNNSGNLFEVGLGGSTYPLLELSARHQRNCILVDASVERLDFYADQNIFTQSLVEKYNINSTKLNSTNINNLVYCHIDGSKDYKMTTGDLKFCIERLAENGVICQDDYGNNKWPTVTDAVQDLIHAGQLVMLIVGDSSCWLTKPEYYHYWIEKFAIDKEFCTLVPFLNLAESAKLHKLPNYLFKNVLHKLNLGNKKDINNYIENEDKLYQNALIYSDDHDKLVNNQVLDYYDALLKYEHKDYLQMPYKDKSTVGIRYRQKNVYLINPIWENLRGPDWPKNAPVTRTDIDNLPNSIKTELKIQHKILNLYEEILQIQDHCTRN